LKKEIVHGEQRCLWGLEVVEKKLNWDIDIVDNNKIKEHLVEKSN